MSVIELAKEFQIELTNLINDYEKFNESLGFRIQQNEQILNQLSEQSNKLIINLKRYSEEKAQVENEFNRVKDLLIAMKSSGLSHNLLDIKVLELMVKNAEERKGIISKRIALRMDETNNELKKISNKITELEKSSKTFDDDFPLMHASYEKIINEGEKELKRLIDLLENFKTSYYKHLTKRDDLVKEESPVEEVLPVEPINIAPSMNEEGVPLISVEKPSKVEVKQTNEDYPELSKLGLNINEEAKVMNGMSPAKFQTLINVLKDFEIDLKEIKANLDEFLNVEHIEELKNILFTLIGIGKDNNKKDFDYMLGEILQGKDEVLQKNLLNLYSRGEDPKDSSILLLLSPYYFDNLKLLPNDKREIHLKQYLYSICKLDTGKFKELVGEK